MTRRYVALGSSFAAGPGIDPIVDKRAGRSGANYAHLVARQFGLELRDVTCSGATTDDVLRTPQALRFGRRVPPQLEAVDAGTDLVTITVGGNDIGYIGALVAPAARQLLRTRLRAIPDRLTDRLRVPTADLPTAADARSVSAALIAVADAVRARAPRARIVFVPYLTVLGSSPTGLLLEPDQDDRLRAVAAGLADAFATAAAATGADLVPVADASADHGVGASAAWVTGLRSSAPFHPNREGMVAVAHLVAAALRA